jgi:hypothetical protein
VKGNLEIGAIVAACLPKHETSRTEHECQSYMFGNHSLDFDFYHKTITGTLIPICLSSQVKTTMTFMYENEIVIMQERKTCRCQRIHPSHRPCPRASFPRADRYIRCPLATIYEENKETTAFERSVSPKSHQNARVPRSCSSRGTESRDRLLEAGSSLAVHRLLPQSVIY